MKESSHRGARGRRLSHVDTAGKVRMVDVGAKAETARVSTARGEVVMRPETLALIKENRAAKGDVLALAQVAGIMAAKRTPDLIPLAHPIVLTDVQVSCRPADPNRVLVEASARTVGRTGVELEALTAAAVAALTIYDMCKAVDREMTIGRLRLVAKEGGRGGAYRRAGEREEADIRSQGAGSRKSGRRAR